MADGPTDAGLRGRDLVGLGAMLSGAVVVGTGLGLVLDRQVDSSPAFTLVGLALGMVAGAAGFWVRVRTALRVGPDDAS